MEPAGDTAGATRKRLYVYSGGFLTEGRVRRILGLAGYDIRIGLPGPDDMVGVWGMSPTAPRGEVVAARRDTGILRVEDAFLRSVKPGREAGGPLGLLLDRKGVHFDPSVPSQIETILATDPLDDGAVLSRARDGIERLKALHLSKYNIHDPALEAPAPGYVLLIDQTRGDASVTASGATEGLFREMLFVARDEHPGARIVIRTHPETMIGRRPGYFGPQDTQGNVTVLADPVSPWRLLEGAIAVYTVSSQLGFEAILAGHRPRVFGQPFYAGWGLTEDERPLARRMQRRLTRAQIAAAAMILAPVWHDPCRDRLCSFEEAVDQLEAEVRAFREDRAGHVAGGMRLWKRPWLAKAFGRERPLRFARTVQAAGRRAAAEGRGVLVWGMADAARLPQGVAVRRIEDGFLRSRGLGAALVPPLSVVADDLGMYYDPVHESRLERLIAEPCPAWAEARAGRLIGRIVKAGLTKYNLPAGGMQDLSDLPKGQRILVPGQVEDDASIRLGAGEVRTNLRLLERVRAENPAAVILYKPHPDVVAGLRPGAVPEAAALAHADRIVAGDPAALLAEVNAVWTMTSGLGFEALIRGTTVVTLGVPWYSGWGLTRDLLAQPARRTARPTLAALAHAALVAYPRYLDPVSGLPCPPEVVAERLARGEVAPPGRGNRWLAKLQGVFAGQSWLWR